MDVVSMKERQEFLAKEVYRPETKDEMLKFAAEQFEFYAEQHRAKFYAENTQPGRGKAFEDKAKVNMEMAAACRHAMGLTK